MNIPNYKDAKKRSTTGVRVIRNFLIDDKYKNIGKDKTYFIKTYGCQMNERDSETLSAMLESMSYKRVDDYLDADLILLNTCAIRENVHNKVFGMLGRLKHLREEKKGVICGLCGCMAQEEIVVSNIIDKYKWLDFVFGTHNMHMFPEILFNSINNDSQEIDVWSKEGDIIEDLPVIRDNKYKAYVNIMYGCDKFCTYCIVPYTRGKQRSRLKEDILKEVNELIKDGYSEVTLLGQNVNAYGKDLNDNYYMEDLLLDVSKTGIKRIKFVTSHPWDFTDNMIEVIKNNSNIMPYIHLPVQSGSNKILKLMGRKYTKESYIELYNKLKANIKGCSISTDIIVGFPNETREDFDETLNIVNECKFDMAYTFIYSKRDGTPAAKMVDDISDEEKELRLQELNKLITKYSLESNELLVGHTVSVLFETKGEKENTITGYTEANMLVNAIGDISNIGTIKDVTITNVKSWSLYGDINE